MTCLGKDLLKTGVLNDNSSILSIRSIVEFKAICDQYNVHSIRIIGTSALREARDSADFIEKVRRVSGLKLEIIPGETEAELTLAGISNLCKSGNESSLILAIDVGGGSTELILAGDSGLKCSIPVGALKLSEQFPFGDPPSPLVLRNMKTFVSTEFIPVITRINEEARSSNRDITLIATGGTATNLASISLAMTAYDGDKVHGHVLQHSALLSLFERLSSVTLKERCGVKGLEMERADIILSGIVIILSIMESLDIEEITVSDYGLMEGLMLTGN